VGPSRRGTTNGRKPERSRKRYDSIKNNRKNGTKLKLRQREQLRRAKRGKKI
jgi:hypothetical protein